MVETRELKRELEIQNFLKENLTTKFERIKIPGDASFRRYERVISDCTKYILMDAPPEKEDVKPFIKIANILLNLGLSAPKIIAQDVAQGFLLLEDLGDEKYSSILINNPNIELELYQKAVDVLAEIYTQSLKNKFDVAEYSKAKLLEEANLFINWYLPLFKNFSDTQIEEIKPEYEKLISEILDKLYYPNNCLVLRDYHADNLMVLARDNLINVGLLDFQDALIGNVAYDLVSLLEDARRDVSKETQSQMLQYFCQKLNLDESKFFQDYYILGAQRNLKILGIFARLKVRDGKDNYLKFIPRVKNYLLGDLEHPALNDLKKFISDFL